MCIKEVDSFEEMEKVIDKFKKGIDYHFTEEIIDEVNYVDLFNEKKLIIVSSFSELVTLINFIFESNIGYIT